MKRKAFTLVELLVVIAILAILGTVSIVGYTSFTTKAKLSNDENLVTQWNGLLEGKDVLEETPNDFDEAKAFLLSEGKVEDFTPKSKDYHFYWCYEDNRVYLIKDANSAFDIYYPKTETVVTNLNSLDLTKEMREQSVTWEDGDGTLSVNYVEIDDSTNDFTVDISGLNLTSKGGIGEYEYGMAWDYEGTPSVWQSSNFFHVENDNFQVHNFGFRFAGNKITKPSKAIYQIGGSCFVAGTQITMADGTFKNIEDIKINDQVMSYDVINNVTYSTYVFETFKYVSSAVSLVKLSDGIEVECTPTHPLLTTDGFKSVNPNYKDVMKEFESTMLNINDEVITDHGNFKVVSIETSVKSVPVYNFHVQDNGNYLNATHFANAIVVHNASGC